MEPKEGSKERGDTPARTSAGGRRCAIRVIRDQAQGMVVVYEVEPSAADAGPRALVFEWGRSKTRLEQYPAEWRRMRDDELLALRHGQS